MEFTWNGSGLGSRRTLVRFKDHVYTCTCILYKYKYKYIYIYIYSMNVSIYKLLS